MHQRKQIPLVCHKLRLWERQGVGATAEIGAGAADKEEVCWLRRARVWLAKAHLTAADAHTARISSRSPLCCSLFSSRLT